MITHIVLDVIWAKYDVARELCSQNPLQFHTHTLWEKRQFNASHTESICNQRKGHLRKIYACTFLLTPLWLSTPVITPSKRNHWHRTRNMASKLSPALHPFRYSHRLWQWLTKSGTKTQLLPHCMGLTWWESLISCWPGRNCHICTAIRWWLLINPVFSLFLLNIFSLIFSCLTLAQHQLFGSPQYPKNN